MTYECRAPKDYVFGTLSAPAAISDTTITSAAFVPLSTGYTTSVYLPVIAHDPSRNAYEVMWATGHAAASANLTVARGKEGTTAQAWAGSTQVVCAPSVRDGLPALTRATLPADAHYGMRALVADESVVTERTVAGWGPSVGVANPADVGPRKDGTYPPAGCVVTVRAATTAGITTDTGGYGTVTYRTPFPNGTIAASIISAAAYNFGGRFTVEAQSATGFTFIAMHPGGSAGVVNVAASATIFVTYIAIGY